MAIYEYNLVDADSLVYAAGFACQTQHFSVEWKATRLSFPLDTEFDGFSELRHYIKENHPRYDRNFEPLTLKKINDIYLDSYTESTKLEPLENCLHTVRTMVEKIKKRVNAKHTILYLAPDEAKNFRTDVDTEYKANRVAPKPHYYDDIRKYLNFKFHCEFVDSRMEVDDAISITAAKLRRSSASHFPYCITRIDKDLRQIPGTHYLWKNEVFEEVGTAVARRSLWTQVLTGDSADNIKGLPKIGPVKAARMLNHIDWRDEKANEEALRTCGLEYAIRFDDPETELFKTISLVKLLTVNIFDSTHHDEFI